MEFFVGDGDFSSEKLGKIATELNLARDWHWEIDRETANSSLQSTAAKIEQRWLALSNGGGGVTATRGKQKQSEKERVKGLTCSQTQREARECSYRDGGAANRHDGVELLLGGI